MISKKKIINDDGFFKDFLAVSRFTFTRCILAKRRRIRLACALGYLRCSSHVIAPIQNLCFNTFCI